MPKFENMPNEEDVKIEPMAKEDAVSDEEKEAFMEMQRHIELRKSELSEDQFLPGELEKMIESLPNERLKKIIRVRYLEGLTAEQARIKLKMSKKEFKQDEHKALRMLRHPSRLEQIDNGAGLFGGY